MALPNDGSIQATCRSVDGSTSSLGSFNPSSPALPDLFVPPRPASAPSIQTAVVKRPAEREESLFSKKGSRKKSGATLMDEAVSVMKEISKQKPPSIKPGPADRDEIFGLFVASRVRIMDEEKRKQCEKEIISVLMGYRKLG